MSGLSHSHQAFCTSVTISWTSYSPCKEKTGILPTLFSTTTSFSPPWHHLLPSTLRYLEPFRVSGTSQYGDQTVLPMGWPKSTSQGDTCDKCQFHCCATEGLQGWASFISISYDGLYLHLLLVLQWHPPDEPLYPPWNHGTRMKILLEVKPTV